MARSAYGSSPINKILAGVLMTLVAIAPIPLGSNRPVFWILFAVIAGIVALVYGVLLLTERVSLRIRPAAIAPVFLLGIPTCAWLVVQALPIGNWPITTQQGATLITPTISLDPGSTLLMLARQISYGLFLFLFLQVCANRTRALSMLSGLFIIITVYAAYSLVALTQLGDPILIFEKWAYEGAATGTFVNRNSFATFLALGCVLGLSIILRESGQSDGAVRPTVLSKLVSASRIALLTRCVALAIIIAALLATQSRMGLMAALCGMGVVMAAGWSHGRTNGRFGWLLFLLGAAFLLVSLFLLFGSGVLERLGSVETNADVRLQVYRQVMEMIGQNPFFGYGGGAFELAFPLFQHPPVSPDLRWDKAHSTYLTLWAELGILFGTLLILIHAWFAVQTAWRAFFRDSDWAGSAAAFAAIVVGAIHSTVDFSLEMQANMFLLLAIVSIGLAAPAPGRKPVEAMSLSSRTGIQNI